MDTAQPAFAPHVPGQSLIKMTGKTWFAGLALVLGTHIAGLIYVLTGRSFYWDDFIIVSRLADHPLFSREFLFSTHDGHFAPLSFLVQGLTNIIAPWNWLLPAAIIVSLKIIFGILVAHLMALIAGRTWVSWFVYAVILWCPLVLPGSAWWSAAINSIPFHIAFVGFLILAIRMTLRYEALAKLRKVWTMRAIVGANLLLLMGLGFFEKSLSIVPLAFLLIVSIAYMERRNVRAVLARGAVLWGSSFGITLAWLAGYVLALRSADQHPLGRFNSELFFNGLGQIFSGMVGGPWLWERWAPGQPFAVAPTGLIAVGGLTLLLTSAAMIGRDYRGWLPWFISVAHICATLTAIVIFRSSDNTSGALAQTLHYYADVAIVIGICLAISCAGNPPEVEAAAPLPKRSRLFILGLGVVLAISSAISHVNYRAAWQDTVTDHWLATTKKSLYDLQHQREQAGVIGSPRDVDFNLLDQAVPYEILMPVTAPANTYAHIFNGVDERPNFSRFTGKARMFNNDGSIIDAKVAEVVRLNDGPTEQCGHRVETDPNGNALVELPLSHIVKLGDWVFEFNATASEPMDVRLSLPNPFESEEQTLHGSTLVPTATDLTQRLVSISGGGNTLRVTVQGATPGATLCIGSGAVGPLVPANA